MVIQSIRKEHMFTAETKLQQKVCLQHKKFKKNKYIFTLEKLPRSLFVLF
jgi:hypothetical protein